MKKQAKEKERSRPTKLFTFHSSFFTGKSRKEGEERKDKNEERREQKEKVARSVAFSFCSLRSSFLSFLSSLSLRLFPVNNEE